MNGSNEGESQLAAKGCHALKTDSTLSIHLGSLFHFQLSNQSGFNHTESCQFIEGFY